MARRITFAVGLALLIVFFTWYTSYIERSCEDMLKQCEGCVNNIKNNDLKSAKDGIARMLIDWEKYSNGFEIVISNMTVDNVNMLLKKADSMLDVNSKDMALDNMEYIHSILEDLPKKEHLNWGNIF